MVEDTCNSPFCYTVYCFLHMPVLQGIVKPKITMFKFIFLQLKKYQAYAIRWWSANDYIGRANGPYTSVSLDRNGCHVLLFTCYIALLDKPVTCRIHIHLAQPFSTWVPWSPWVSPALPAFPWAISVFQVYYHWPQYFILGICKGRGWDILPADHQSKGHSLTMATNGSGIIYTGHSQKGHALYWPPT